MPMRNSPSTVSSSSTIRRANGPGRSSNYRRGSNSSSGARSDGSERTARAAFAVRTSRSRARNGKSTFLAAIFIVLFALDCGQAAEAYSRGYQERPGPHYLQRSQANGSQLAELRAFVQSYRSSLHMPSSDSNFESLSRDEKSLDKLNIHAAGVDELHAHPTRAVWDVIDTATGARTQPLIAAITTAGFNTEGICYELRGYCIDVLDPDIDIEDDAWFAFIAALDDQDDWQDESVWIKANPNLGVSCFIDDLRDKAKRARRNAAALNNFLCKHLNRWTQQAERWIPIEDWDACRSEFDVVRLEGRDCVGGLDVSEKSDLNAFALIFPAFEGEPMTFLFRFWLPEDTVEKRREAGDHKYDAWVKAELLEATPGNVSNYDIIRDDIKELAQRFNILQIGFDPWNALHLATQLAEAGITMVEVPQNFRHLSEAAKDLEAKVLGVQLRHNGDKVARWMMENVAILRDNNGNIRPVKPKDRLKKIDGIVAAVIANSRLIAAPADPYTTPEVITV